MISVGIPISTRLLVATCDNVHPLAPDKQQVTGQCDSGYNSVTHITSYCHAVTPLRHARYQF